ncbi:RIIa domain-containing protein 1 isoform X1 [Aquila chrysaetos chrysaetos]|uniref:RIIa domain-containing protein 1 isoform X1 n=1 Tax=Aquila chrysaetos chrysaetos TaxID=223781 RepID=UPI0011771AD6|nr:RIIa domain-containing protein 1 isoform X1 [Aquila chrysaetos chrysaetos]
MASPQSSPRPHQTMLCLSSQRYLRARPAVRLLLRGFLRELLLRRPDDVLEFAAGEGGEALGGGRGGQSREGVRPPTHPSAHPPTAYFTQPELPGRIQEELGRPGAVP